MDSVTLQPDSRATEGLNTTAKARGRAPKKSYLGIWPVGNKMSNKRAEKSAARPIKSP